MLVLKTIPLLAPLFGILNGRRYTYQWSSMLILAYFAEGTVRLSSDPSGPSIPALLETTLSLVFFLAALLYAKSTGRKA